MNHFKKTQISRAAILSFIIVLFTAVSCSKPEPLLLQGRTMGTTYSIKIADRLDGSQTAENIQRDIDSLLKEINRQMSTYIPASEISRFNSSQSTEPFKVSKDFIKVLSLSMDIYKESGGAFDVTIGPLVNLWGFGKNGTRSEPPAKEQVTRMLSTMGTKHLQILGGPMIVKSIPSIELDFGAIAKGYGVDAAGGLLLANGFKNFMIEIGGEVVVKGTKAGEKWKIGIDRPAAGAQPGQNLQAILNIEDIAAATSGDYRNYFMHGDSLYSHEIDPRNGRPIQNGAASVTVLAPSCMLADAMATAIMVMGKEDGLKWVESKPGIEAMIIVHDGKDFKEAVSSGFKAYL